MVKMTQEIGNKLKERSWRLAVAESCTGGMVCARITDVAGSSHWFGRGFITYTNESKTAMLDVPAAMIEKYGAVSPQIVKLMAKGALANSQSDIVLAISGIAGPSGGTDEKPVGTVCFSWMDKTGRSLTETMLFVGDRASVRLQATDRALTVLLTCFLS